MTLPDLTELTAVAAGDLLMIEDVSASATKKITWDNLLNSNIALLDDGAIGPAKRSGGFKVGTITLSGTGNLATTGVGFTPKLVEFTWRSSSSSNDFQFGAGMMDGTNQRAIALRAVEGGDISNNNSVSKCIIAIGANGAITESGTFVSFDADGFTINIDTFGGTKVFYYKAFG